MQHSEEQMVVVVAHTHFAWGAGQQHLLLWKVYALVVSVITVPDFFSNHRSFVKVLRLPVGAVVCD